MLGGPALGGARAVVVGPDDLVLKAGATRTAVQRKDLIEHHLGVVHLARVDVQKERTGGRENAVRLHHARAQEADVVVKAVAVGRVAACGLLRAVALAAKSCSIARRIADGLHPGALLGGAGVEWRVDVDQLDARAGQGAQGGEVFAVQDAVGHERCRSAPSVS